MLRNLSRGDRGNDVLAVQKGLNLRKLPTEPRVDEIGVFGPATDAAVRRFQSRNGLVPDGIVGAKTRAMLFPLAVVTVQTFGFRLRLPSLLDPPSPRFRPNLFPGQLTLGSDPAPTPGLGPLTLPTLAPSFSYQPIPYPRLQFPIATPPLTPPTVPGFTIPVHHFELQPGTSVSFGRRVDVSFSLTVSGVVMIGPENGRHQEFASGIITSTPGVRDGGEWTVGWFAQLTHVEQLARFGNFTWQPNTQVVAGHGGAPFLSVTAAPANVQFDANNSLSISIGGPSVTATFAPEGASLSWGLASFGLVGKF